jgi:hypothetical protein
MCENFITTNNYLLLNCILYTRFHSMRGNTEVQKIRNLDYLVEIEVMTAVTMNNIIFSDVT